MQVVRRLGMDDQVDPADLVLLVDPEAHQLVDHESDDARDHEGVDAHRAAAEQLPAELVEPAAVQQAIDAGGSGGRGDQADAERADHSADQVDADDVEPVVVAPAVLQPDRERADHARDDAHHHRADRRQRPAGRGDGDQAGHQAGRGAQRGGVTVPQPLDEDPAQRAGGAREERRREDHGRGVVGTQGGAGVEAEPAEPQQAGAQHHQGQVVRPHRLLAEPDPPPEHEGQRERRGSGGDLDRGAASEVDHLELVGHPAADVVAGGEVEDPVRDGA